MSDHANYFYKKNGYYIATQLLVKQRELLLKTLLEFDTVLLHQLVFYHSNFDSLIPSHDLTVIHQHLLCLLEQNHEAYIASLKLCANLLSTHSLLMHEEIIKQIKALGLELPVLQAMPVLHIMADDLQIPGGYYGAGVHQDWPSLQGSLDTIIVWIPFMMVNKNNFSIDILPGSHLGGLYPGELSENIYKTHADTYNENDFTTAELAFGDVLFMSAFTLHRTHIQANQSFRIACSTRYDNASEDSYIERKYPFAQKRIVTRDFLTPNFPSIEQVRKVF